MIYVMKTKFKEFLDDGNSNEIMIFTTGRHRLKMFKEQHDERFIVIYAKIKTESLEQYKYFVAGYYDCIDKVLYNHDVLVNDLLREDTSIKTSDFNKVLKKIGEEIDVYIEKHILENFENYSSLVQEKDDTDLEVHQWDIENSLKKVEKSIIDDFPLSLNIDIFRKYEIYRIYQQENKYIIKEYLNNPHDVIKKYATNFIKNKENELCKTVLLYENQLNYLNRIKKTENNEFDYIYTNKKLIESIKDIKAQNVNIKLNYNGNEITFKYKYDKLLNQLKKPIYKGYAYNSEYTKVENFLRNNNIKDDRGYDESDFSFEHITSITYGKKILYERKNTVNKQKVKGVEQSPVLDEDLEMEM